MSKKEFIVWGIPEGKSEETLLLSEKAGIKTIEQANNAIKLLEEKYGCKKCRIQIIDMSEGISADDFINTLSKNKKYNLKNK
jgi:hypothetical protein